jgi:hypothetical protein
LLTKESVDVSRPKLVKSAKRRENSWLPKIANMMSIRILTLSVLIFTSTGLLSAQGNRANDPIKGGTLDELKRISCEIYDAGIAGNRNVIEKYLADNFLETDAVGELHDKTWNLSNFLGFGQQINL